MMYTYGADKPHLKRLYADNMKAKACQIDRLLIDLKGTMSDKELNKRLNKLTQPQASQVIATLYMIDGGDKQIDTALKKLKSFSI